MVDFLCRLPLWLIPALPTAGFLVLALFGARLPRRWSALIGVGSVGLAAATTLCTAYCFLRYPPEGGIIEDKLWTWIHVGSFEIGFSLVLDGLSLVMIFVVTFVGFLIHLYSTEYMADDPAFSRFFAYMNLFVAFMLMLVLADNLFLLYLGWEGVGLCSYLLIGFWYTRPRQRRGRAQGLHRHPGRRHRHGRRPAAAVQTRGHPRHPAGHGLGGWTTGRWDRAWP